MPRMREGHLRCPKESTHPLRIRKGPSDPGQHQGEKFCSSLCPFASLSPERRVTHQTGLVPLAPAPVWTESLPPSASTQSGLSLGKAWGQSPHHQCVAFHWGKGTPASQLACPQAWTWTPCQEAQQSPRSPHLPSNAPSTLWACLQMGSELRCGEVTWLMTTQAPNVAHLLWVPDIGDAGFEQRP